MIARNRALLAVLIDAGLTSSEVRTLALTDFVHFVSAEHFGLLVAASGNGVAIRRVPLTAWSAEILTVWLHIRQSLDPAPQSDRLFVSRRGRKPLEATDVLSVVMGWLKTALPRVGLRRVDHMGVNVLRTAAIVWWRDVDNLSPGELIKRAGFAELQALRRLPPRESLQGS